MLVYVLGAAVVEWLSSWLAEQGYRGSIPGLANWIFRDWLSPASKSRYGCDENPRYNQPTNFTFLSIGPVVQSKTHASHKCYNILVSAKSKLTRRSYKTTPIYGRSRSHAIERSHAVPATHVLWKLQQTSAMYNCIDAHDWRYTGMRKQGRWTDRLTRRWTNYPYLPISFKSIE